MAQVTLLDAFVNRTTEQAFPTISAGTDRAAFAVFAMYNGGGNAQVPTTVTCNGVSGQWIAGDAIGVAQTRLAMAVYMFLETNMAAISGQAITTSGQVGTVKSLVTFSVSNYPQSTNPQRNSVYTASGGTGSTLSLTRGPESLTIALSYVNTASTPTTMADPSRDGTVAFANGTFSYASESDTDRIANHTASGGTYRSSLVFNLNSVQRAIVSVNGGSGVTPGSTGNTAVLTGYSNVPTSITIGGKAATNIGGTSTNVTFDFPDYIDLQTYPDPTGTHSFVATYNTETANINVALNLKTGRSSVTLLNPNATEVNFLGSHLTVIPVSTDKLIFVTSDVTFYDDTSWDAPGEVVTEVWHWVNATDTMYQYFVTLNDAGEIVDVVDSSMSVIDIMLIRLSGLGYTGTLSEMFLEWLLDNGATTRTMSDAIREFLIARGVSGLFTLNDGWFNWLGTEGYTGTINDRNKAFWIAGGVF